MSGNQSEGHAKNGGGLMQDCKESCGFCCEVVRNCMNYELEHKREGDVSFDECVHHLPPRIWELKELLKDQKGELEQEVARGKRKIRRLEAVLRATADQLHRYQQLEDEVEEGEHDIVQRGLGYIGSKRRRHDQGHGDVQAQP